MAKLPASTELAQLKAKCLKKDGTPRKDAKAEELVRLKVLIDAEPLTQAEIDEAKKRESERHAKDVANYQAKKSQQLETLQETLAALAVQKAPEQIVMMPEPDRSLDIPPDHPRIMALKNALKIFTQIECHPSRPDDFILFCRGVNITAGDVRTAQKAMRI